MTGKKTPSIIVLSAAFLFIFLLGISRSVDFDIFFHLSTARQILSDGRITISPDPFSFTSTSPMSTTSWLADIIFYAVNGTTGIEGLIIFKALTITAVFFFLYLNMRGTSEESRNDYVFAAVLLIAAFAVRMRMFVRPFIFEFLLLAVYFHIIDSYRIKGRNRLFLLPALQIIWVNVHPSSIMGVAVAFAVLGGETVKHMLGWGLPLDRKRLLLMAVAAFSILAVTAVNPEGYRALIFPFALTGKGLYMANIGEWQPLRLSHLTGYSLRYTWGFFLLVILSVVTFLYRGRKTDLTELVIFALFLFMAIKRIRFSAEFTIAVAPIAGRRLASIASRLDLKRVKTYEWPFAALMTAALAVIFYVTVLNSKTYAFGVGFKERFFPIKAVDFVVDSGIRGNVYNSIGYGGYLVWRLFPGQKVFIDGRNEVYDEEFYRTYLNAHTDPDVWKTVVDKYNMEWVILEYFRDYSKKERMPHLVDNPGWALVYWDRIAAIYAKRGSANDEVIRKYEYRYARPNDLAPAYLDRYFRAGMIEEALGELKRNVSLSPENEEAHLFLAYAYYNLGMTDMELGEMKNVVRINPDLGFAHSSLGELYLQTGDAKAAGEEFQRALKIDPVDNVAIEGLKRLNRGR